MVVPDWVSSLKRVPHSSPLKSPRIAFERATLRWNTGKRIDLGANLKSKPKEVKPKKTIELQSPNISNDSTAMNTPEPLTFQLTDLTINFPIGKLTVITGPTGAGKTGVLVALLGEMELLEGTTWLPKETTQVEPVTKLRNSVAYAAQTPWLQQKSIKDNILFGEEYDEVRYEATLDACAL